MAIDRVKVALFSKQARFGRFFLVGGVTAVIQLTLLHLLTLAGLSAVVANFFALSIAVQANFLISQAFVWQDRQTRALPARWLTYHACLAGSLVLNFGAFLVAQTFLPPVPAALVGTASATLLKFVSLDRLAFPASQSKALGESR